MWAAGRAARAEGLPGQQPGGAWADRHTSSGTGDRVGCQQSQGNYQRGAWLIPPPSPLPIPLQGSQLPAGKWVFRGYYGHTDSLLTASRLHVSPRRSPLKAATSPTAPCCPSLPTHWQQQAGGKVVAPWPDLAEPAYPSLPSRARGQTPPRRSMHLLDRHQHRWCQVCLEEDSMQLSLLPRTALQAPFPTHCPGGAPGVGCVGAGGPPGHSVETDRTVGEERGRGYPARAGRVKVVTDFGIKYEPCTGPSSRGSRVRPSVTVAPVEGDTGADAQ